MARGPIVNASGCHLDAQILKNQDTQIFLWMISWNVNAKQIIDILDLKIIPMTLYEYNMLYLIEVNICLWLYR